MRIFRRLSELSRFRRRHMAFIESLVDLDLLREIGLGEENGRPATLTTLLGHGVASVATVQRRLRRLKRLGLVRQVRSGEDARVQHLVLSPRVRDLYRRMGKARA